MSKRPDHPAGFSSRLRSICRFAQPRVVRFAAAARLELAIQIAEPIGRGRTPVVVPRLREAIEQFHRATELQSALDRLASALARGGARIEDLDEQPSNAAETEAFLRGKWSKRPKRAFVYVAWRSRPETYLYVGKVDALHTAHRREVPLACTALSRATRVAVLVPPPGSSTFVADVHAALVAVLRFYASARGMMSALALNVGPPPRVDVGDAAKTPADLVRFLRLCADELALVSSPPLHEPGRANRT